MKSKISYIIVFLCCSLLVSTIALAILYNKGYLVENHFGYEIGKTCLQIFAVTVFGTFASFLLNRFNNGQQELVRRQEQRRVRNDSNNQLLKKIIASLNEAYADVKLSRRMLRARALSDSYKNIGSNKTIVVDIVEYDKYLEIINDSQLAFEIIEKEIETNNTLFESRQHLIEKVRKMHNLMNQVVEEYETFRPSCKETILLEALPKLKDVLTFSKDTFLPEFVSDYKDVLEYLRKNISEPDGDD